MYQIYTFKKERKAIDFQSLITKLVDIIQATKDQDTVGMGLLCT